MDPSPSSSLCPTLLSSTSLATSPSSLSSYPNTPPEVSAASTPLSSPSVEAPPPAARQRGVSNSNQKRAYRREANRLAFPPGIPRDMLVSFSAVPDSKPTYPWAPDGAYTHSPLDEDTAYRHFGASDEIDSDGDRYDYDLSSNASSKSSLSPSPSLMKELWKRRRLTSPDFPFLATGPSETFTSEFRVKLSIPYVPKAADLPAATDQYGQGDQSTPTFLSAEHGQPVGWPGHEMHQTSLAHQYHQQMDMPDIYPWPGSASAHEQPSHPIFYPPPSHPPPSMTLPCHSLYAYTSHGAYIKSSPDQSHTFALRSAQNFPTASGPSPHLFLPTTHIPTDLHLSNARYGLAHHQHYSDTEHLHYANTLAAWGLPNPASAHAALLAQAPLSADPKPKMHACNLCPRMFNRPNGLAIHVKSHKRRAAQLQAQAQAEAEAEAEADAAGVNHQRGEYDQEDENPRKRARRAKSEELELMDISRGAEVQMQVQMQNVDTDVQAAGDSNVERLEYHGFHVLPGSSDFSLSLPVPAQFNYSRPRYPSANQQYAMTGIEGADCPTASALFGGVAPPSAALVGVHGTPSGISIPMPAPVSVPVNDADVDVDGGPVPFLTPLQGFATLEALPFMQSVHT